MIIRMCIVCRAQQRFQFLAGHNTGSPVTSVALSNDDSKGFFACKNGIIREWNAEIGNFANYN